MSTVDIHIARLQLFRLVDEAAAGKEIVLTKDGEPVAKLVPLTAQRQKRELGLLKGTGTVPEDFDAPLPDELLDGFEGR